MSSLLGAPFGGKGYIAGNGATIEWDSDGRSSHHVAHRQRRRSSGWYSLIQASARWIARRIR